MSAEQKRLTVSLDIDVYQDINKVAENFGLDFGQALNLVLHALFSSKQNPLIPAPVTRRNPE